MANTYQFALPLVEAAQAQKHVTVNEALARLDAAAQLRVVSGALSSPPGTALDGEAYIVPVGATGAWAGRDAEVALFANGGWVFLQPKEGWRAWNEALGDAQVYIGGAWVSGAQALSPGGAATIGRVIEIDHGVASAASSVAPGAIPANSVVLGVSGRVTAAITGSAATWSLGVQGSANRYGSGLGLAKNAYANGLTGSPQAYYADTDLILTADSGAFTGGSVRLAVHVLYQRPPSSV